MRQHNLPCTVAMGLRITLLLSLQLSVTSRPLFSHFVQKAIFLQACANRLWHLLPHHVNCQFLLLNRSCLFRVLVPNLQYSLFNSILPFLWVSSVPMVLTHLQRENFFICLPSETSSHPLLSHLVYILSLTLKQNSLSILHLLFLNHRNRLLLSSPK